MPYNDALLFGASNVIRRCVQQNVTAAFVGLTLLSVLVLS